MAGAVRLSVALALTAAFALPSGRAASPLAAPASQAANMIAVDFYAVTAEGKPIPDLRPDEVTIRINGRTKAIRSLQFVEVASLASGPAAGQTARPLPPAFGSNSSSGHGRVFLIVIDDESLRPGKERPMRAAIAQLLANLSARDRVSVHTIPHGGMKIDLTTDHDKVAQAVSAVTGQGPQDESGQDGACRTRNDLESLEGLLYSLSGGEGPTVVLFFSTGLLGPRRDNPVTRAPGMCELTPQHFVKVGTAAAAARAHFYVIRPDEGPIRPGALLTETIAGGGFAGSDNPLEGLENLAGVTGGHRLSIPATGETTLIRVARETSGYYLASVEPEGAERDSLSHGLDVKVTRPGVTVRSRPEFTTTRPRAVPALAAGLTPYEMLRTGRVLRDLPLRAAGFPARRGPDGKLNIIVVAEAVDPATKITAAAAGIFDSQDRLVDIWNAAAADLGSSMFVGALPRGADPGTYRLRVAARDDSGRGGTADYEVIAQLGTSGPLKLSSLVLGLSRNSKFEPRLQFKDEPVALAYLELYGGTPGARISAIVEVAHNIDSPALLSTPLAIEGTSEDGRYLATGAVPIGALPAGDYVVRAVVAVEGQTPGQVTRTLRKVQ